MSWQRRPECLTAYNIHALKLVSMTSETTVAKSPWAPLRRPVFRILWTTGMVASLGIWMQDIAGAWLMTLLDPRPIMVSLMQTATYLPYFLLSLPAGALADVVDRRTLILIAQAWVFVTVIGLGLLTISGAMTAWLLLIMILISGLGATFVSPAWNALPPELVPGTELEAAVALNSLGFNCARGIGAALGGLLIASQGPGWVFLANAASMILMCIAVYQWKRERLRSDAPAEKVIGAIKAGLRYVRHSRPIRAVLMRTTVFVFCGSAVWGLLPLFARQDLKMDSIQYGLALGVFGLGTLAGAVITPRIRQTLSLNWLMALSSLLYALGMIVLSYSNSFAVACGALFAAGVGWLVAGSCVNAGLLMASPQWVRARAVATYLLVFQGCLAFGSLAWGSLAQATGIRLTLLAAAGSLIAGLAVSAKYSLGAVEQLDMRSSGPSSLPTVAITPHPDRGPIQVSIEYSINAMNTENTHAFVKAMAALEKQRRRNGAHQWHLFVDLNRPGIYIESFFVESWGEYLRQRQRATVDDLMAEKRVLEFHTPSDPPKVTRLLAERRRS